MALTADQFSTTITTPNMTSTPPITHSKDIHTISEVDGGQASSHFGVYQQTTVGSGDVRSGLSYRRLSTPFLIVRRWFPNFSSAKSSLSLTRLPSPSAIKRLQSHYNSLWARYPLRGRRKPLLQLFVLILFSFPIYRALDSPTLLGSLLQSQTRTSALQILHIFISAL